MKPVVVLGAGNAALCAAISAREQGADVVVLEAAPLERRGGNTFYSGAHIRLPHDGMSDVERIVPGLSAEERRNIHIDPYTEDDYIAHWEETTGGRADLELASSIVDRSRETIEWMRHLGTLELDLARSRITATQDEEHPDAQVITGHVAVGWLGGGVGLSEGLFAASEDRQVEIRYGARAVGLVRNPSGEVSGVQYVQNGLPMQVDAKAVVMTCGGFEANPAMRAAHLGKGWDLARVRGTEFNVGDGHRMALEVGARPTGNWSGCHAIAWEFNSPEARDHSFAHGYERHSYPVGLVVNSAGERFVDEGENFQSYTYAKYGKEILKQPDSRAWQLFDKQCEPWLRKEYSLPQATRIEAQSVDALAEKAGINVEGLRGTILEYNAAVSEGAFDPSVLDGKSASGVTPRKSNWALKFQDPPFVAYPVTCGITFTFGGVSVDHRARVLAVGGEPIKNLYAAGEMVGGLFYGNYPAATGLLSGAVLGRSAGLMAGS